jgi:hypothetical protein
VHRSFVRTQTLLLATVFAACGANEPRTATVDNTEPTTRSTLCDQLHPGPADTPGIVDAKQQCGHYRDELSPPVAAQAVACMEAAGWDVCQLSPCTERALTSQTAPADERCKQVGQACPAMTELCGRYIAGMNESGKDRFAKCLQDNCGLGVRACLWDSMVTPCDQGGS